MIIPIRCFTCGKVLADKYEYYIEQVAALEMKEKGKAAEKDKAKEKDKEQVQKEEVYKTRHFDPVRTGPIMDAMGLTRYCCRRHMLSTVDMMEII